VGFLSAAARRQHSNMELEFSFPDEILIKIFSHCDLQTLYNVVQVCHRFKQCADVQSVWYVMSSVFYLFLLVLIFVGFFVTCS